MSPPEIASLPPAAAEATAAAAVVPDETRLRRLEWRVRDLAESWRGGELRSAYRGRGREFDQVVRYEWGDDIRDIDWNVTARLGEPYRKKFVEERELTLLWLFEDSPSLQFGSGERTRREVLAEAVLLLAMLSAHGQDRVGFWHAHPDGARLRPPVRGRGALRRLAGELSERNGPAPASPPAEIDWTAFARAVPRHSVVLWFSDFPPRPAPDAWASLARTHELIGVRVDDPWDRALPDVGPLTVLDPSTGELLPLDTGSASVQRRHAAWVEEREACFQRLFPDPLSRCVLRSDADVLDGLTEFLRARMRAIRS